MFLSQVNQSNTLFIFLIFHRYKSLINELKENAQTPEDLKISKSTPPPTLSPVNEPTQSTDSSSQNVPVPENPPIVSDHNSEEDAI